MLGPFRLACWLLSQLTCLMNFLSHFAALGVRYHLFTVFYYAGMQKFQNWEATLNSFQNEYKFVWLPLPPNLAIKWGVESSPIPPLWAAYAGTAGEILLPILVLIGLGARLPILALFILNYAVIIASPTMWTDAGLITFKDHLFWGALMGFLIFNGPGKISLDQLFKLKCKNYCH